MTPPKKPISRVSIEKEASNSCTDPACQSVLTRVHHLLCGADLLESGGLIKEVKDLREDIWDIKPKVDAMLRSINQKILSKRAKYVIISVFLLPFLILVAKLWKTGAPRDLVGRNTTVLMLMDSRVSALERNQESFLASQRQMEKDNTEQTAEIKAFGKEMEQLQKLIIAHMRDRRSDNVPANR